MTTKRGTTNSPKKSSSPIPAVVANPTTIMLGVIVAFIVGIVLYELRPILLPFVIALFFSIIFSSAVAFMRERRIPTVVGLAVVLLSMALILFLVSLILYSSVESFAREMPKYERRLSAVVENAIQTITQTATDLDLKIDEVDWRQAFELSSLTATVTAGLGSFLTFLTNLFLILLFMMFMLGGSGLLGEKIQHAFPARRAEQFVSIIDNVSTQVRQYLITKTLISLGTGILTFFILLAIGVDFALIWATLAFLLNFIPNIGSIIAVALPTVVSILQFDTFSQPLLVLVLLGITQVAMGNVLEPRWMATRLNLSALVVLVSLIFWGWLWGVWGMILAVPIMATIKIVFENIEPLRPLSLLMSGAVPSQPEE